jgi:quercetin dioxygenase-like cupin family protein
MGFWVCGETMTLGPGSAFVTPIGLPHTFSNRGTGRLRFVLTASPASHLGCFERVAELLQEPGPPDPQSMMAIMQKWGLEPIRPA